jgi:hypothetical protein
MYLNSVAVGSLCLNDSQMHVPTFTLHFYQKGNMSLLYTATRNVIFEYCLVLGVRRFLISSLNLPSAQKIEPGEFNSQP